MTSVREVAKRVLPPKAVDWIRRRKVLALAQTRLQEAREAQRREPGPTVEHVVGLEVRLWSTGKAMYADRLARVTRLTPPGSRARVNAALALARWEFSHDRSDLALERIDEIRTSDPFLQSEVDLLRVDCLCDLGQGQTALTVLSRVAGRATSDHNLQLRVGFARSLLEGSKDHGSGPMAEALNVVYNGAGFGMIRRASVIQPISLDNIACEVPQAEPREGVPLVTVITWLSEAAAPGYRTLSSLLDQSWENLEILLLGEVNGRDRLMQSQLSGLNDPRIVLVSVDADSDRRWAAGVDRATGAFITTHHPGSWAHPQRVEAQARSLLTNRSLLATVSSHTYVNPDLTPRPTGLAPGRALVGPNPRSMMVRASGLGPDGVIATFHRVSGAYSEISGELNPVETVSLVSPDVPLTLSPETRRESRSIEAVPG